jgi:hypothetical protein
VQQVYNHTEKSEQNKGRVMTGYSEVMTGYSEVMTGYSEVMTPEMARKKLPEGNPLPRPFMFKRL